jgi:hypothetical protein
MVPCAIPAQTPAPRPKEAPRRRFRREADLFVLRECPQCSYDLKGLPREHLCPECGLVYDTSMFVVDAWTKEDFHLPETQLLLAKTWRTRVGPLLRSGLGIAYFGILGWVIYALPGFTFLGVILGIAIAGTAWRTVLIRSANASRRGTVRWVFSLDGVAQQTSNRPIQWIPWERIRRFDIRAVQPEAWRVRLGEGRFGLNLLRRGVGWLTGHAGFDGIVTLSRRQAALLRTELRDRIHAHIT